MNIVRTITLPLPFRLGTVNCYLVDTGSGFVLIDTGSANRRTELVRELRNAGCEKGALKLIVLTHGDFDHTGNAAYLRGRLGAEIAMHPDDGGMAEQGDMFWNRSAGNRLVRWISPLLFGFSRANRFRPDLWLQDGDDLAAHGLDARVLSLPGHSRGSIGILTAAGDLFCGDLLESTKEPAAGSIVDDPAALDASLARLRGFEIKTVYPGHGRSFPMPAFLAQRPGAGREG